MTITYRPTLDSRIAATTAAAVRRLARRTPGALMPVNARAAVTLDPISQVVTIDAATSFTITLPTASAMPFGELQFIARSVTAGAVVTLGATGIRMRCTGDIVRLVEDGGEWVAIEDTRRLFHGVQVVEDANAPLDATTVVLIRTEDGPYDLELPPASASEGLEATVIATYGAGGSHFVLEPDGTDVINGQTGGDSLPLDGFHKYSVHCANGQWWVCDCDVFVPAS